MVEGSADGTLQGTWLSWGKIMDEPAKESSTWSYHDADTTALERRIFLIRCTQGSPTAEKQEAKSITPPTNGKRLLMRHETLFLQNLFLWLISFCAWQGVSFVPSRVRRVRTEYQISELSLLQDTISFHVCEMRCLPLPCQTSIGGLGNRETRCSASLSHNLGLPSDKTGQRNCSSGVHHLASSALSKTDQIKSSIRIIHGIEFLRKTLTEKSWLLYMST